MLTLQQVGNVAKTVYQNETEGPTVNHVFLLLADGIEIYRRNVVRPARGPKGKAPKGGKITVNFALNETQNGKTLQSTITYTLTDGSQGNETSNTVIFQYKIEEGDAFALIMGPMGKREIQLPLHCIAIIEE